ncbi:MAG: 50S ribosomal protein L23 [Bdellovibrionales bacterium RIFOXYC1_FULL_54_43]|nr:MAG: 50S ribosomal protein L23 [Bdellovibrionales bacterium RIFOXYC1_FULL_54_43]OFZ80333.1 MAG: 50S ribosomal protein L23 [Bdellovibrionales bacterium RIFOXYD1_FULL_55_31]
MRSFYDVVKRPIISEKSTALAEVAGRYAFEVALQANKQEIKDAVQRLFNVKVREVRTMVMHGKVKRVGRFETKRSNWKKALVTLAEGQKIDFFQTK